MQLSKRQLNPEISVKLSAVLNGKLQWTQNSLHFRKMAPGSLYLLVLV
jgi:hypothetical protein